MFRRQLFSSSVGIRAKHCIRAKLMLGHEMAQLIQAEVGERTEGCSHISPLLAPYLGLRTRVKGLGQGSYYLPDVGFRVLIGT